MPDVLKTYLNKLRPGVSRSIVGHARAFCSWLGDRDLDREAVEAWLRYRARRHCKPGTLKFNFGVVKRVFDANGVPWPFSKGEGPSISERDESRLALGEDVILAMIRASASMTDRHRAFLAVSTTYGIRRVEIGEIGDEDFEWESRLIYVETQKGGRQRYHLIPDEIFPHLRAYRWRRISPASVSSVFAELKAATGLVGPSGKGAAWHAIRHTITQVLMRGGLNSVDAHNFMRWKTSTRDMAERYASPTTVIHLDGKRVEAGASDVDLDKRAFSILPWLAIWKEIPVEPNL